MARLLEGEKVAVLCREFEIQRRNGCKSGAAQGHPRKALGPARRSTQFNLTVPRCKLAGDVILMVLSDPLTALSRK